jgi:hypothetical protein
LDSVLGHRKDVSGVRYASVALTALTRKIARRDEFRRRRQSNPLKEDKIMSLSMTNQSTPTVCDGTPAAQPPLTGGAGIWSGRVLSGLVSAFLLFDGTMKLFKPVVVVKTTVELGYPESSIVGIGLVLLVSTFLYIIPRTSVLGAILLTGYLGGAVATHVRVSAPLFNIIFPIVFGAIIWGGLWLRDERVRQMLGND